MIDCRAFADMTEALGYDFAIGVPCSYLADLINVFTERGGYLAASIEGEAVAIAAGARLAGRRTLVLAQNSGLGNMINPLTSLNVPAEIPALILLTWRGSPQSQDEPQHAVMGGITPSLLELLGLWWRILPASLEDVASALQQASNVVESTGRPAVLLVPPGTFSKFPSSGHQGTPAEPGRSIDLSRWKSRPSRYEALERITQILPSRAAVIATTGKCARELFTIKDAPQHFYVVGAMGSASGIGLGVALNYPEPVVVLDGDGAALMRLGTLVTIGGQRPRNLIHVLLDNGAHDSTGGQPTGSERLDLGLTAATFGYPNCVTCDTLDDLEAGLRQALAEPGPHMIRVHIGLGSIATLARPSLSPAAIAERFSHFLRSAATG